METKAEKEARLRREANQARVAGMLVAAIIAILSALIMGLFSKNKAVRLFSGVCLLAILIGGALYIYKDEISAHFLTNDAEQKVEAQSQDTVSPTNLSSSVDETNKSEAGDFSQASLDNNTPSVPAIANIDYQQEDAESSHKSPHFAEGRKYDWQRRCQNEWGRSFLGMQRVFSAFGGFVLTQQPVDLLEFSTEGGRLVNIQPDVPLQKPFRQFQNADLEFFHGALIGFTLKAHFAPTYSKGSIEREFEAMAADVVAKLERLHRPDLGIIFDVADAKKAKQGLLKFSDAFWYVHFGMSQCLSEHQIIGDVCTMFKLNESENGYDMRMTVEIQDGVKDFIELVLQKVANEAGEELPLL